MTDRGRKKISNFIISAGLLSILILSWGWSPSAQAQRRVDLGDMEIKGALHGDGQLNLIGRQRNELRNHVQYRENFRPEITEEVYTEPPSLNYQGPRLTRNPRP